MADPFNSPATGGGPKLTDFPNRLVLVTPTAHETGIKTKYPKVTVQNPTGLVDAIRADFVVIDEANPAGSESYSDTLIFQGYLIGSLKPYVGKGLVLGRLHRDEPTGPSDNPPWLLNDATEAEKVTARAYLASKMPAL